MRLALDTNRYTDLCRGNRGQACYGQPGTTQRGCTSRFLLKSGVRVLYADEQTTHHYGAVYRQLRKQGSPIPTNDMWIAALVLQHSLVLCARDAHFDVLPQLPRVWLCDSAVS